MKRGGNHKGEVGTKTAGRPFLRAMRARQHFG